MSGWDRLLFFSQIVVPMVPLFVAPERVCAPPKFLRHGSEPRSQRTDLETCSWYMIGSVRSRSFSAKLRSERTDLNPVTPRVISPKALPIGLSRWEGQKLGGGTQCNTGRGRSLQLVSFLESTNCNREERMSAVGIDDALPAQLDMIIDWCLGRDRTRAAFLLTCSFPLTRRACHTRSLVTPDSGSDAVLQPERLHSDS